MGPTVINWRDEYLTHKIFTHEPITLLWERSRLKKMTQQPHISQKIGEVQKPVSTEGWNDKAEFIYFKNV